MGVLGRIWGLAGFPTGLAPAAAAVGVGAPGWRGVSRLQPPSVEVGMETQEATENPTTRRYVRILLGAAWSARLCRQESPLEMRDIIPHPIYRRDGVASYVPGGGGSWHNRPSVTGTYKERNTHFHDFDP